MSIKRYDLCHIGSGIHAMMDDSDGKFVKYEDYAESERYGRQADITIENLERKVEQLAAENAWLKAGAIKAIEDIQCFYDSEAWHVSEDGESETAVVALDDAKGSVEHFVLNVKTPATESVLAEVRAQGVEMFASKCKEESKRAHSSGARDSWWVSGENADDFASQLRKGEQ